MTATQKVVRATVCAVALKHVTGTVQLTVFSRRMLDQDGKKKWSRNDLANS